MSNQDQLNHLRHSCAHLLAAAVLKLYPHALPTIGPAIEDGFYYDFDFGDTKISNQDLDQIETQMRTLVKDWQEFTKQQVTPEQAKAHFANNPYKLELIEEFTSQDQPLTFYQSGEFIDLCRGGHCLRPYKDLKHFKLLSVAGAYWRGNEKNKMLTRIYGTCYPNATGLTDHLTRLEEAKQRDHKKLGKELDLFVFSETVGKGLPLFTPKGSTIRRELERFITDEELKRDYVHVYTPDIASLNLYKKSGHYPYYKDSMYAPITIEDEEFMLRPMTCPHHFELYSSHKHSYKELPIRIAELAQLYRFEKSGELMGLQRVRTFCLADAHIIARPDQAYDEINNCLNLIDFISQTFGLQKGINYSYRLSLGNRDDDQKYFKDDKSWDFAENTLRQVLQDRKDPFVEAPDEAAFYGPKIDIQMKNVHGKEDTAFTVQYDFVMPTRFNLTYTNANGQDEQPIVIHRSSIGAIERIMAFLIEHFAGNFPLWLSPVQVKVLPISDKVEEYANQIFQTLKNANIRTELDTNPETIGNKIRIAQTQKTPYMLIVGEKESESNTISIRTRTGKQTSNLQINDFITQIRQEIDSKNLDLQACV